MDAQTKTDKDLLFYLGMETMGMRDQEIRERAEEIREEQRLVIKAAAGGLLYEPDTGGMRREGFNRSVHQVSGVIRQWLMNPADPLVRLDPKAFTSRYRLWALTESGAAILTGYENEDVERRRQEMNR
jgi:hypothetical protein